MHMHLNFVCKRALNFSALPTKLFNSGTKLPKLLTQHYEPISLQILRHSHNTPTFKLTRSILLAMKGGQNVFAAI